MLRTLIWLNDPDARATEVPKIEAARQAYDLAHTQQNAALVEESAAAAESLNQQAQTLMTVVSKFRLKSAEPA